MRRSENRKKRYHVEKSGFKILTGLLMFFSFVIVLGGILSKGGGMTVSPIATPSPTPLNVTFDETADSRQVSIEESVWYALQLAVFESKGAAEEMAKSYVSRGAAGYVLHAKERYRVLASVYPAKEEAQAVRNQLKQSHGIDSYIYEMTIPQLTLKISGMKGQVDVIDAALQFLREGLYEIQKTSVALDEKQANRDDVANNIKILSLRAKELTNLFQTRFTNPKHGTALKIESILNEYMLAEERVSLDDSNGVTLAAELKQFTLRMIDLTLQTFEEMMQ